jgi:catechol 2,3-dioxygenase-like lactoylglutathione lyase family enzyme
MNKPQPLAGLRHVALFIKNWAECDYFYTQLLGMTIDWRPDDDNLYLTSGTDNLALHRAPNDFVPVKPQRLDHFGFFLTLPEDVDEWHAFLASQGVTIIAPPKNHRDGTRSFYCADPDGNVIQLIHYPLAKMYNK